MSQRIDPVGGPANAQIARDIRESVHRRERRPGDKLPSQNELAAQWGVAVRTAAAAIELLRREGLVTSQTGVGSFINPMPVLYRRGNTRYLRAPRKGLRPFQAEVERSGRTAGQRVLGVDEVVSPPDVAERLGLEPDVTTIERRHLLTADGYPMALATAFYRHATVAIAPRLAELGVIEEGSYVYLADVCGILLVHFTEELRARQPSAAERGLLHLRDGEPVIELVKSGYTADDLKTHVATHVAIHVMAGDSHVLVYELPAV